MSDGSLRVGSVNITPEEEDWIAFVYDISLRRWREKNKKAEIICFKNDGRHLYILREKWILVRYNIFHNPQILRLKNEEIIFKHGAHLDSSRGVKSLVRIFLFKRHGRKRYRKPGSIYCTEILIPAEHHCYIAVNKGRVISSLLLHSVG